MGKVGNHIWQRQVRVKNQMKWNGSKAFTLLEHGLTRESLEMIWLSITNQKYVNTSNKYKWAVDVQTKRMSFTHKLGPRGVAGIIKKFVSIKNWMW